MPKPKPRTDLLPSNSIARDKARKADHQAGAVQREILLTIGRAQDNQESTLVWPVEPGQETLTKPDILWLKSLGYHVYAMRNDPSRYKISWVKVGASRWA